MFRKHLFYPLNYQGKKMSPEASTTDFACKYTNFSLIVNGGSENYK